MTNNAKQKGFPAPVTKDFSFPSDKIQGYRQNRRDKAENQARAATEKTKQDPLPDIISSCKKDPHTFFHKENKNEYKQKCKLECKLQKQ